MKIALQILLFVLACFSSSCSYYARNSGKVSAYIQQGNNAKAYEILTTKTDKWEKRKDKLLYYLNRAEVAWMLGKNEESIEYFKKADYLFEDQRKKVGDVALSLFVNKKASLYTGSLYENVMLDYYQIINYIQINDLEKAEIQARRLILVLDILDDSKSDVKFIGNKESKKFQKTGFGHLLLGVVYELKHNYNAAFISYRNAYKIYENDNSNLGVSVPLQLKKDLIRMAYKSGFYEEMNSYQKLFKVNYNPETEKQSSELVFFWNNGMIPETIQNSLNFTLIKQPNGYVNFVNATHTLSFSVYAGEDATKEKGSLAGVSFVRIAYPVLFDKFPFYTGAVLDDSTKQYSFEKAEDLHAIAHRIMKDKTMREMGEALLRLALKKAAEAALNKENETAGALLNIANLITEQADTRSWNTLPRDIFYSRVPLKEGTNNINLKLYNGNNVINTIPFKFNAAKNKMYIQVFQSNLSK